MYASYMISSLSDDSFFMYPSILLLLNFHCSVVMNKSYKNKGSMLR